VTGDPENGPDSPETIGDGAALIRQLNASAAKAGFSLDKEGKQTQGEFAPASPKSLANTLSPSAKTMAEAGFVHLGDAERDGQVRTNIWRVEIVPVVKAWEWQATIVLPSWVQQARGDERLNPAILTEWDSFTSALAAHEGVHAQKWQQFVRQYQDLIEVFAKTRFYGEAADPNDQTARLSGLNGALKQYKAAVVALDDALSQLVLVYERDQVAYDEKSKHGRAQSAYDRAMSDVALPDSIRSLKK